MEAAADAAPDELEQLGEEVQRTGMHRNLRLKVVRTEGGEVLIIISNRSAAAAYRLQPGWIGKFRDNVKAGLFG